jgi:hypothetical protein
MQNSSPQVGTAVSAIDQPGAFQCMLLRAIDLQKTDRDVFLLKEVQGHTLAEISAILGIRSDEAVVRLKRACREMDPVGNADAVEAYETTAMAKTLKPTRPAIERLSRLTGLGRLASLTGASFQATLACWVRDKFLELIEVAQRTAPTVIVVALTILR